MEKNPNEITQKEMSLREHISPTYMASAEESEYEKFRRIQIEQFEDDITEGRCYPEMPEGQFVRSK